jgi:AmmeMemoRadiSam system protein A
MPLSLDQQRTLFNLVRDSIRAKLEGQAPPALPQGDPDLERVSGAFVTLRSPTGDLRGCIGHAIARMPLAEAVRTLAVSAAFRDHRFEPLASGELAGIDLELSILSPLFPLQPEAVEVGTHGLVITRGSFSGLLLPQVATSRDWNAEQFLNQTCRKAGLPQDAWKLPDTQLEGFTCDVYEEPEAG